MAKPKKAQREVATATLANGSKVSGPPAVVARLVARHGEPSAARSGRSRKVEKPVAEKSAGDETEQD